MTVPAAPQRAALLADIGGTHARFALKPDDRSLTPAVDLPSHRFGDLAAAVQESLSLLWKPFSFEVVVREAAIAVAGPVTGDEVELTNVAWRFSIEATRRALGLDRLLVINDVAALAWAIPVLEAGSEKRLLSGKDERRDERRKASIEGKDEGQDERRRISIVGKDEESRTAARSVAGGGEVAAVVAVGTGLGVATSCRPEDGRPEIVLASEGGHRDLAATTEREWRVVERLRARFGAHVSVERAVSGEGLANLWSALAELDGEPRGGETETIQPAEVTRRAVAGDDRAVEAVALLSAWLGAFAGDLALTVGARGGVWLGGGALGALGPVFDRGAFSSRFLGKGRFEGWLGGVPVRAIDDPLAAFHGLARALGGAR